MCISNKLRNAIARIPLCLAIAVTTLATGLALSLPFSAQATELGKKSFIYVESPSVVRGGVQRIAIGLGNQKDVASANLFYVQDGQRYSVPATSFSADAVLFEFPATLPGECELSAVSATYADGYADSYDLSAQGGSCSYVVTASESASIATFSAESESITAASAVGATVYSLDDAGAMTESAAPSTQSMLARSSGGQFTIALDPGHGPGPSNPGAVSHGLRESDLTLSIANYCKAALEKYPGVKVIMTHDGKTGTDDLYERVNDAVDAGADVFVSLHMNSATKTAHGAEVWYPNGSSYKRDEVSMGVTLSSNILNRLQALGLYSRGAKTRDYPEGYDSSVYPDGSTSDYYGIIRYARQRGILGIIVEHAFITNDADAAFLSNEANLKALGEADAEGIARTYGLRTNGSWRWSGGCWHYYVGSTQLTGWFWVTGARYYADASGNVQGPGWLLMDSKWYWFDQSCANVTGWADINGATYYFDHNGVMKTGWATIDGATYYFDASGARQTGWLDIDGKTCFFDEKGVLCVSRWYQAADGSWYWFGSDGARATGWQKLDGSWYWFDPASGRMATGWQSIDSHLYYLGESGAMQTGWILLDGTWYYTDASGAALTGWQSIGSAWYWFDEQTGAMAAGWYNTGNSWSRFADSGAWLGYASSGWNLIDGTWYWTEDAGVPRTGWLNLNGTWYWLDQKTGAAQTGWGLVNGSWYWFDKDCAMQTGWLDLDGTWYYLDPTGACHVGWLSRGGVWYYLTADGPMATGWVSVDGTWYYLSGSGTMQTGWLSLNGTWYYLQGSGAMTTGWLSLGNTRYYLGASGAMVTGSQTIDGIRYVFDGSGALTQTLGPETSPTEPKKTGWSKEGSDWYYYDADGSAHTGWLNLNGTWYYLWDSGVMATGWVNVGGWYYLDDSGAMQTGWVFVSGTWYDLGSDGLWTGEQQAQATIAGNSALTKDAFVNKAVAAFASVGATYPAEALSAGGTPTIRDFCAQLYEEAADEGIRPELVFCQAMKETGWLRFGGRVTVSQFNFAGIGAVDGGTTSASFSSVREGLRAQVQHLKAYAVKGVTESSLAHACVDPRFSLVSTGSAQYVQWLGIKENPQGRGWATGKGYGCQIVSLMNAYFGA